MVRAAILKVMQHEGLFNLVATVYVCVFEMPDEMNMRMRTKQIIYCHTLSEQVERTVHFVNMLAVAYALIFMPPWPSTAADGGIVFSGCPFHSRKRDISETRGGNVFKFHTNVRLRLWMNWLEFIGQRPKVTVSSRLSHSCWMRYLRNTWREFHYMWNKHPRGLKDELMRIWWSKVRITYNFT